jgi:hypothetical protein
MRRGLLFQKIGYRLRKHLFLFIAPIENRYENSLPYRGKCFNQPLILGRNLEVNIQTGEYFRPAECGYARLAIRNASSP